MLNTLAEVPGSVNGRVTVYYYNVLLVDLKVAGCEMQPLVASVSSTGHSEL